MLGGRCVRCGIEDDRVLQIDHIHGGGTKHRASLGNANRQIYREVIDGSRDYQLLCANDNWIKRWEENEMGAEIA